MTLKDELFNRTTITALAARIHAVDPSFPLDAFIEASLDGLDALELKDRMHHVADELSRCIRHGFLDALSVFDQAFEEETESQFVYGAILRYIEQHGCTDQYVEEALKALGRLTGLFSGEFAIRTFLREYPVKTMRHVQDWATSKDVHRRRLASEGTRPSLPWAPKIPLDYHVPLAVLDTLYADRERYVTRSVANHLNDIAKIDPDLVLATLRKWRDEQRQTDKELEYITRHALRTLIKQGHPEAMAWIGFGPGVEVRVDAFTLSTESLSIGETLAFTLALTALESANLLLDVRITYPTKHGKHTSKVYKWTTLQAEAGTSITRTGRRPFRHLSTRTMRPGEHTIAVQINGTVVAEQSFVLRP